MNRGGHKTLYGRVDPRLAVNIPDWLTAEDYIINDFVLESGVLYRCITAHTSATFATDIANWETLTIREEKVLGTVYENIATTGTETIDLSLYTYIYLVLTGVTTLAETNTPSAGDAFVRTYEITGSFAITFPANWIERPNSDAYDGAVNNLLSVVYANRNGTLQIYYCIENQN